jgi:lipopolysaccharide/colanic/teichoic acid biosynthesis glycosyltransferase
MEASLAWSRGPGESCGGIEVIEGIENEASGDLAIPKAGRTNLLSDRPAEEEARTPFRVLGELSARAEPRIEIATSGEGVLQRPEVDIILPGRGVAARFVKRTFDLLFAGLILIVLAPLLAAIALLIKLDSPGPVLYRSKRIGRNGQTFEMLKFRTMFDGADGHRDSLRHISEAPEGLFKVTDDPRFTGVGRALRSTSLDELPQLIHVLTGTMSIVGPRPLVSEESGLISPHSTRFLARPGITGPWQLAGSWRVSLPEMVELDEEYLETWSIWVDLKMLIGTVWYAIRRTGC